MEIKIKNNKFETTLSKFTADTKLKDLFPKEFDIDLEYFHIEKSVFFDKKCGKINLYLEFKASNNSIINESIKFEVGDWCLNYGQIKTLEYESSNFIAIFEEPNSFKEKCCLSELKKCTQEEYLLDKKNKRIKILESELERIKNGNKRKEIL